MLLAAAREFMARGARETNPPVWASYWEHILIAPELGRRIADQASKHGVSVDPVRVEQALWLHDASVMMTSAYNRKDHVGDRLLTEMGLKPLTEALSSTHKLMAASEELKLTDAQIKLDAPLDEQQETVVDKYLASLTPTQRITNLGDNLGKRDGNGLFTLEAFRQYLKTQERRYDQTSPWPSTNWAISSPAAGAPPRRPDGAVLQYYTVKKTIEWLQNSGVDVEAIMTGLADYGPKFVVVVRHGELANPKGIVYNRDAVMRTADIIHLSDEGQAQMAVVAKTLSGRKFNVVRVVSSPETRAQESTQGILAGLKSELLIQTAAELDDALCPGPYLLGIAMLDFARQNMDVYDGSSKWEDFNHETPASIKERIQHIFWQTAKGLKVGETALLVSHGDPIAFLLNALEGTDVPPAELRNAIYPKKGEATVAVIGPDGKLFTAHSLNGPQLQSKIF